MCLFQLHDLPYEILQKPNHLQELFVINIFPLHILNNERNQYVQLVVNKIIKKQIKRPIYYSKINPELMLPKTHAFVKCYIWQTKWMCLNY